MSQDGNVLDVVQQAIDNQATFGELLNSEEKQQLLDHGVVRSAVPGDVLCQQHQMDTRVYILVMGEVEVRDGDESSNTVLARLRNGELFGEISALYKLPRVSTVVVSKPSVLLEIPGDILETVISGRPELHKAVIQRYQQRITDTALRGVPIFRYIARENLNKLIEKSSLIGVPAGADIVKEGEPGDALYIIIYGTARVTHKVSGEELNIALLRAGDYFGEWSILTGAPRAATVSAVTRVEAIRVDCQPFLEFIQKNPEIRDRIDMVAFNRHSHVTDKGYVIESREAVDSMLSKIEEVMKSMD